MDAFQAARSAYLRSRGHDSSSRHRADRPDSIPYAKGRGRTRNVIPSSSSTSMDLNGYQPGGWPGWSPNPWYDDQSWWGVGPYGKGGPPMGQWGGWDYYRQAAPWTSGKGKGKGGGGGGGGAGLFWEDTLGTLPKASQFYCEPCEMDLCTAEALGKHKLTYHVKCPMPGCDYSAPPHLVEAHKWSHMAESKGADAESSNSSQQPEEIQTWLEERRKNFPNAAKNRRSDDVKGMTLKEIPESSSSESSDSESSPEEDAKYSSEAKGEEEEVSVPTFSDDVAVGTIEVPSEEENGVKVTRPKHGMCRFFLERGRCRHGDKCKYKHVRLARPNRKKNKNNHKELVDQLKTFLAEKGEDSDADESSS
ncbi:hypothetical protein Pmar_PMAR014720 [Perkinsus marinus ATCC 50983]|uniref:C3H1-type domain-containing protein n=1 Tax=Perkinsus marinus (strain ATCC 50983 / TXsc) TaxID=423536 RepID=C5LIU8_PERM5|nr:hypothetical protein Pmar_PMAR014720 [Perkinsus marinus ATCC 50983]EER03501.1 hypothetical protein Pmar_PMAR014720 [Perkinsus marinus ATCC 50983]|eukprot:XP_002771685.1 hypothetical protein Pmar_PMAR014720 [Perkinsus marinus ATCC 50983]